MTTWFERATFANKMDAAEKAEKLQRKTDPAVTRSQTREKYWETSFFEVLDEYRDEIAKLEESRNIPGLGNDEIVKINEEIENIQYTINHSIGPIIDSISSE